MVDDIATALKQAQLDRDETKVSTLRLLLSEIKNAEIAKGGELSNEDIISVVQKEIKKRKEAAIGFRSGGREESALKEEAESKVLEVYLPAQMEVDQLTKIIEDTISEACQLALVTGSEKPSLQDMGRIIRLVMDKVKGQADGGTVSLLVKQKLS
ncbi:hypothetical protein A3C59_02210 [Candidatus Daviesbacteria bacterium RIFCSPHIGHO2_02_FULL_36_13]|uniref:GatB/YqeY domain-containing protein n=1 Tax=Candidatus Daviesbacteria bacterium RIFCSPHIGHO2_02_FULL_36_13 TaxID=1797768 RepID=A0A1F5JS08_9BACT|nr:MAG: hypothetical protein A3C59_02210 [Candidatus Daviesbacteria bacterium RIFCSPHIGHO2_02_FULL_36_13]OGE43008.1 MAG: hypothetical protein A3A45_01065 [Candidatus Daviesbacteria bacterium RIFCSPLOWO2_01_FULL_36_8]